MGRELQKKKNRSSLHKVKQKPKSKKVNPQGNATIAANWDQSLTLSQNYRRLGLTSMLNARTGGVERLRSHTQNEEKTASTTHDPLAINSKTTKTLTPSEVQVERDPESGAILRVIRSTSSNSNPLNDPLNDVLGEEGGKIGPDNIQIGSVVQELENQAAMEPTKRPRQQSNREEEWISTLVQKHGENYGMMARDRRLNPYQQTDADIRRRVLKWKASRSS